MSVEPQRESKSVPDLLVSVMQEVTGLFRTETQLLRAEISDKATRLKAAGGALGAGAIVLHVGLLTLTAALVIAVSTIGDPDLGLGWSALIVGLVLAVVGAILLARGRKELDPANLAPSRSAHQLREDAQLVKDQAR